MIENPTIAGAGNELIRYIAKEYPDFAQNEKAFRDVRAWINEATVDRKACEAKGEAKGIIKGKIEVLSQLYNHRLSQPIPEVFVERLHNIQDISILNKIIDSTFDITSADEFDQILWQFGV